MTSTSSAAEIGLPKSMSIPNPLTARRGFLAGFAALPLIGGRVAPAAAHVLSQPDAKLLALRDPWLKAIAAVDTVLDRKGEVEKQVFSRSPSYPDWKTFEGTYEEQSALYQQITALREAIQIEVGADEVERLVDATQDVEIAIVDAITAMPALTLAGLAFKVEVSAQWEHDRIELTESIMNDILAMAGGANA